MIVLNYELPKQAMDPNLPSRRAGEPWYICPAN